MIREKWEHKTFNQCWRNAGPPSATLARLNPASGQRLAVASDVILEITVCKSSAVKNAALYSRSCVSSGTSHLLTNAGVSRASGSDDGPD